jgi:small subunit ribosomal protein S6
MEERLYDLIFIARPATPEEEIKKVIATLEHACEEKGGKIEKTEHWGTRKLAYKVMKHREGIYVYQQVRTNHGELVHELERRLGVADSIIKYQTVRLDEDLKRQKKLSHKREIRTARRPRRTLRQRHRPSRPRRLAKPRFWNDCRARERFCCCVLRVEKI